MSFQLDNDADITGTTWTFSTIQATLAQMTRTFGEPLVEPNSKTQRMWVLRFGDLLVTVYDWKNPQHVSGDMPINWHIGTVPSAPSGVAVSMVHNAFRSAMGLQARSLAA